MRKTFRVMAIMLSLILGIGLMSGCSLIDKFRGKDKGTTEGQTTEEFDKKLKENADSSKNRVSGLLLGTDGGRTDTIMFVTYDMDKGKVNIVSVPRDTYYYESQHAGAQFKKINAAYTAEGIEGTINAVEDVLGIKDEISFYAKIDYKGVENIVDSVGGVEVNIPETMDLIDDTVQPIMVETLEPGTYTLNGQEALAFVRQRKSYENGDLGRVNAQQEFISSFISKAMSLKLPTVISTVMQEVETNANTKDALYYGVKMLSLDKSNISMTVIPGEARTQTIEGESLSYYIRDEEGIKNLMNEIMNGGVAKSAKNVSSISEN